MRRHVTLVDLLTYVRMYVGGVGIAAENSNLYAINLADWVEEVSDDKVIKIAIMKT